MAESQPTSDHANRRRVERQARQGIAAIFLISGLALASWISRIPAVTDKLELGTGQLGLGLMTLALGAIVAFPATGRLVDTLGSAKTLFMFAVLLFLALPVIGLAPHLFVLMPILFVFGAGNGGLDVSMNAQGIEIERLGGSSIMNSLHGYFSVGTFAGALIGAGAAALDVPPIVQFVAISVLGLTVLTRVRPWLIADQRDTVAQKPAPAFSLPPRSLWVLGALAICVSISEGAMADWGGLYMREELGTSGGIAALGYAVFSVFMLTGRFSGDKAVARFGAPAMVRAGGILAAAGLTIGIVIHQPVAMFVAFACVGLGLSVGYPLVFSAAGNHPTLSPGQAVAGVATMGYGGFLAGPPVLGWLAEPTSLRFVMAVIVVLAGVSALLANATGTAATSRPRNQPNRQGSG